MRSIYLQISTFQGGFAINAIHYYGCLKFRTNEIEYGTKTIEIEKVLTREEAVKLTKHDGGDFKWKKGMSTTRFENEAEIKAIALEKYKSLCDGEAILVLGRYGIVEPQEILDGPEEYKKKVNKLYSEAVAIDFWEKDDKMMTQICDKWNKLNKKFGVEI